LACTKSRDWSCPRNGHSVSSFADSDKKMRQSMWKETFDHKKSYPHHSFITMQAKWKEKKHMTLSATSITHMCLGESTLKRNWLLYDTFILLDMQSMNTPNLGRLLYSGYSCADIAKHIPDHVEMDLSNPLLKRFKNPGYNRWTHHLKQENSFHYQHYEYTPWILKVQSIFCDLVGLNNTSASKFLDSMLQCMHKHGFARQYILQI
jgi:hypothetical protein